MLLIGSDPEFILTKENKPISSYSANIPGDKSKTHKVKGGFIHKDNVLLEIGMKPSTSPDGWCRSHHNMIARAKELLPQGVELSTLASAEFPDSELWHPDSHSFGCSPDTTVWDPEAKQVISSAEIGNIRVAGGHIHIGYPKVSHKTNMKLAIVLDVHLGLPSVLMDTDKVRRKYYGKAGSFRHKPYGMEYRVLSNFWTFSDNLLLWAYFGAVKAYQTRERTLANLNESKCRLVRRAINSNDEALAAELCAELGVAVNHG